MTDASAQQPPEPELTAEQLLAIQAAETMFEQMCKERHEGKGRQKYGELTFLDMPTLQMAMEEVVDMANYARYTFIRLVLLQLAIDKYQQKAVMSRDGFYTMEQITGAAKKI